MEKSRKCDVVAGTSPLAEQKTPNKRPARYFNLLAPTLKMDRKGESSKSVWYIPWIECVAMGYLTRHKMASYNRRASICHMGSANTDGDD